jgi:DNA-binding response OmpR family regulator
MKILVIDDDLLLLRTISRILNGEGYEVLTASEGTRGMALFNRENPDLVITDVVMPGQEGLETILTLHRDETPVKIIAMSGSDAELLDIARLIGADAVIEKPFRPQELLAHVRALNEPQLVSL